LGDLVEVDPSKLNLIYGGPRFIDKKELLDAGGAVLPGNWDTPHAQAFEDLDVHRGLRDHIVGGRPWEETEFYARVVSEIRLGQRKWGCSSEREFRRRCNRLDRLYERIRDEGYKTQFALGSKKLDDEVRVAVRRDGRLLFIDGRHRVSVARLLGLAQIPVRIVARHAQWQAYKDEILAYAQDHGGRIYQTIDHPDLVAIPASHGRERFDMLRHALGGQDWSGARLLDIGAHWGAMTQELERLGFIATAVERNKRDARIAERIRIATESRFSVWHGSIFDFPGVERADVVLALNIFHHFIKTKVGHARLERLLGRLRARMILFEAHRHDPPAQMRGAYRNYRADEFAAFVSCHARMSRIDELGQDRDGRTLYRLT